jgi:CheY-like chemotaxis protein
MEQLSTILIVEDEADDIELLDYALTKAGVDNPRRALRDGDEAAAYIGGSAEYADRSHFPLPGLVLLDLKLPRRSGFEVLECIRNDQFAKHIPVIVLTSSDNEKDIVRAYAAGANSYLVKPVKRDALLTMVKTLDDYWIKLNRNVPTQ